MPMTLCTRYTRPGTDILYCGPRRGHVARHVMQKHARAAREERKGEGAGVLQRAWRQRGGRKGVEERRRERERELEAGAALWSRLTAARAHRSASLYVATRVYCHVVSGHAGAETVQWAWQARAARRTLNQVRAGSIPITGIVLGGVCSGYAMSGTDVA
eukprot:3390132-Rhodomonas_salina.2